MATAKKITVKDIINIPITDTRKVIKTLTDKQLEALRLKLERFHEIADDEQDLREQDIINAELDAEIEESMNEDIQDTVDGKYPEDDSIVIDSNVD